MTSWLHQIVHGGTSTRRRDFSCEPIRGLTVRTYEADQAIPQMWKVTVGEKRIDDKMCGCLCDSASLALLLNSWNDSLTEDSRIKDATKNGEAPAQIM